MCLDGRWSGGEGGTKTEEGEDTEEVSLEDSDPSVYLIRCAKVSLEEKDRERI